MGYKNFQVPKTVWLPITYGEHLSVSEYKEKYGIDLKDYFVLKGNGIEFKNGINTELKLVLITNDSHMVAPYCNSIADVGHTGYASGSSDGALQLYPVVGENSEYAFDLRIDLDDDFIFENIVVSIAEI